MPITATRLVDEPLIHPAMDERIGSNINGPSLIRVPDWVEQPLGHYYLYFAHHKGTFIRLAYADALTGPWTIHTPGVLDVSQSLFAATDPAEPPPEQRPSWANILPGGYLYAHVASPDVHIDESRRQIHMYYHGLLSNGDQMTRVAYSDNGLSFTPKERLLGPPYFRVLHYESWIYAVTWRGIFLRSRTWRGPFETQREPGPAMRLFEDDTNIKLRHPALGCQDNVLHLFFSCTGDCPERIYHSQCKLHDDWDNWEFSQPQVILSPELSWEGADLPPTLSVVGTADSRLCELRDPGIFTEDGKIYLLYSGAGESAIGIAQIDGL
ncbi:MAG TPA: hypothetical protein QF882_08065 [Arenicellales bacterium]|mgnify:CR=1 FL=1|nr:hypothetical protein [Arenicellales bacterium]